MGTLPPPRRAREVQGPRVSGVQKGGGTPSGCLRPHSRPLPQVPRGPAPAPIPTEPSHQQNPLQPPAASPPPTYPTASSLPSLATLALYLLAPGVLAQGGTCAAPTPRWIHPPHPRAQLPHSLGSCSVPASSPPQHTWRQRFHIEFHVPAGVTPLPSPAFHRQGGP